MAVAAAALLGSAALGAGSSLINTGVNAYEAYKDRQFNRNENEKSRVFNAEQAQLQRDFEKQMAETQYQRTVADMEAAGINPASLATTTPTSGGVPASAASSSAIGSSTRGVGQLDFSGFSNALAKAQDLVFAKNKDARDELYSTLKVNANIDSSQMTQTLKSYYSALRKEKEAELLTKYGIENYTY